MNTSKTIIILVGICLLLSVTLLATESKKDTLTLSDFASDLRYIPEMQARAADSLYLPKNNIAETIGRDSLFSHCAQVGYEAIEDQMQHYYEAVLDAIPEDADRLEELDRIRKTVERIGGSILRRELDFAEAIALPDNTDEKRNKKIAVLYALADRSVARKDVAMEMRTLTYLYRNSIYMNNIMPLSSVPNVSPDDWQRSPMPNIQFLKRKTSCTTSDAFTTTFAITTMLSLI